MADIYDNALCTVNGKLLVQATTISVEFQDGDKPIPLLGGKFAVMPTGRVMKIAIGEAISTQGLVFDWLSSYLNVEYVKFGVILEGGGRRLVSRGVLTAPGFQFAVGNNSMIRVGFVGEPVGFS